MNLFIKIITLILGSLLALSIAYNVKQYRELKNHHREIVKSTMNLITTFHEAFDEIEKDVVIKEKNEFIQISNSLIALILGIGINSIVEIYHELSDDQKVIVWEVRQYFLNQLALENNE